MSSSPLAVARTCLNAYVDKDRSVIEAVLADDFHFTSPIDNALDRKRVLRHGEKFRVPMMLADADSLSRSVAKSALTRHRGQREASAPGSGGCCPPLSGPTLAARLE